MDDATDGRYSRAPELEDLVALCRALNEAGARYVLIGGFAVILHGFVRGTKDIDLLIEGSDANVQAVKAALAILPDNAVEEVEADDFDRYAVVRVADEVVVDLMIRACDVGYADAVPGVEIIELEDVAIPVAGKELLIRTKDTVRESDAVDVRYLRLRSEEEPAEG